MTPADLELAVALRQLLRHPLVREELRAIVAETAPTAGERQVEGYIGTAEAARRAGRKTKAAIVAMIDRGVLPAVKVPGCRGWRIRPSDLEAVLSGEHTGTEPLPAPVDLRARAAARAEKLAADVRDRGDR